MKTGQKKTQARVAWVGYKRLAIPYFRMATCHTIIGAKRFHCRVRDGIGWFTLAMVTKQTGGKQAQGKRPKAKARLRTVVIPLFRFSLDPAFFASAFGLRFATLLQVRHDFGLFFRLLPCTCCSEICNGFSHVQNVSCIRLAYSASGFFFRLGPFTLRLLFPKPIGCYMVKPHGQLVHVSFTHYCASTPCLSTL